MAVRARQMAVASIVFLLACISFLRRPPGFVELPYWFLTYRSGFVRRGFIGTFISPIITGGSAAHAVFVVCVVCGVIAMIYLAVIAALTAHVWQAAATARQRALWLGLMAVALASPGLPKLAFDFGKLDTIIALLALVLAVAAWRRVIWLAVVLAAIGPLVHEAFFFLALPPLANIWWNRRVARRAAAAAAVTIGLATLAVWNFSTADFAWQAGIPLASHDLAAFAQWQLGQHATLIHLTAVPAYVWAGAFGPPMFMIALLCLLLPRGAAWAAARVAAGTVFSVSIIAIAIDTERLADWACLTAPALCGLEVLRANRTGPAAAHPTGH